MVFKDVFGQLLARDFLGEMVQRELCPLSENATLPKISEKLSAEQIKEELKLIVKVWEGRGGPWALMRLKELAKVVSKENFELSAPDEAVSSDPSFTNSMASTASAAIPEKVTSDKK